MADKEEGSERGFTIVDRRGHQQGQAEAPAEPAAAAERSPGSLPEVDFSSFALSLGTSALYHLGVVPDPETGEPAAEPNLAMARQTIDALSMLETKTRGNLEEEETRLLESLLYELRLRFVEASKAG